MNKEERFLKYLNDARANFSYSGGVSYEEELFYLLKTQESLTRALDLIKTEVIATKIASLLHIEEGDE